MNFSQHIKNYFPAIQHTKFSKVSPSDYQPSYFVKPDEKDLVKVVCWPPNIFLILYTLLDYTDKYRLLVAPQEHFNWKKENLTKVEQATKEWAIFFEASELNNTSCLLNLLNTIFNSQNFSCCVYDLINTSEFSEALFTLLLSIDKAFNNKQLRKTDFTRLSKVEVACLKRLVLKNALVKISNLHSTDSESDIALESNLADNYTKAGFVSYKSLVPQSGLTINNLCQNLTYIKPSVKPQIVYNYTQNSNYDKKIYNVLFIPWPFEIGDESFVQSSNKPVETDCYFDFFAYQPSDNDTNFSELSRLFLSAIISGLRRAGKIDLIVLPECSVSEKHFERLRELLWSIFADRSPSLLAGVYGKNKNNEGINQASLAFIGNSKKFDTIHQSKHHRWFLDKNQIRTYNLGTRLDPGKKWWENIAVSRRKLAILTTPNGIKLCPLVCEDLARQEPVAQAVRAIGPNFVVSLLLDGPQLESRWPGKYSAVLSDDPGCSVLSVTPLGMTLRSTGSGFPPSRVVALWSEPGGSPERIEIENDGIGVLIELNIEKTDCWSIDGQVDEKTIPKKEVHTTLTDMHVGMKANMLKDILRKEIRDRGVKK